MIWYRLQIALVFVVPAVLFAALYVLGKTIPVPHLGRDYVIHVEFPEAGTAIGLPQIEGPEDASRPLVVLDAGHGGHDPGASGEGFREKTIVLGLVRNLRDQLLAEGGIRVALTRSDDTYLALAERVEIARSLGADLFISVHADSAGDRDQVSGASIYTLSDMASSEAAARFAQRENEADMVNGVVLSGENEAVSAILVELSQRQASSASDGFAELVVREGTDSLEFHAQPLRSAALGVLRAPDVPSVLFEAGFITNPDEARRLASVDGQREFSLVMARAIRIYFARNAETL